MRLDPWAHRARDFLASLSFALVMLLSTEAHAHPGEFLRQVALHPTDPLSFAVRYEAGYGGLLFSRDGGKSLQIVPGQAFYLYPLRWRVPMLIGADGKLQLSLDDELRTDDGRGCNLDHTEPALQGTFIADVAPHPRDPATSFVVTSADAPGKHAGLWKRDAQGVIAPIGAPDVAGATLGELPFRPTSLRVIARSASVEGLRFIEGGFAADPSQPATTYPVLRVSDDLGTTWSMRAIPNPDNSDGLPRVLVVSSSDPFRALVALEAGFGDDTDDPNDPIYLTKDSGQSFTPYLNQIQVASESLLLPSGQILLADRGMPGGLWTAPNFDLPPTKIQDWRVHCLAYQETTQKIFMCTRNELGYYDAANNSFCAFFDMSETTGLVSCPAAPLQNNAKATAQLCNNYCSAQHYAEAKVCSTFDVGDATLCGPAAVAYDQSIGYVPPPGHLAHPRCTGFPATVTRDAGLPFDADAGSAAEDAGDAAGSGADASTDDADEASDEPGEDDDALDSDDEDALDEDADGGSAKRKKKKGCACEVSADDMPLSEGLPVFALALVLFWRSRRRPLQRG